MNKLIDIIQDYQRMVEALVKEFKDAYQIENLLEGWHKKVYPQNGVLPSGVEYEFHGVGCCFIINGKCVDMDFGHGGRCDGFDLWRISFFVEEWQEKYPMMGEKEIKQQFADLVKSEVVKQSNDKYDKLYYFSSELI